MDFKHNFENREIFYFSVFCYGIDEQITKIYSQVMHFFWQVDKNLINLKNYSEKILYLIMVVEIF